MQSHVRPLDQCRIASDRQTVREVIVAASLPGRRTGAIMLLDDEGQVVGHFHRQRFGAAFRASRRSPDLDEPIRNVMTAKPCTVPLGSMMSDAVAIMAERKISELPVVDAQGIPVGLIDITDLMARLPGDALLCQPVQSARPKPRTFRPRPESARFPIRVFDEPAADAGIVTKPQA